MDRRPTECFGLVGTLSRKGRCPTVFTRGCSGLRSPTSSDSSRRTLIELPRSLDLKGIGTRCRCLLASATVKAYFLTRKCDQGENKGYTEICLRFAHGSKAVGRQVTCGSRSSTARRGEAQMRAHAVLTFGRELMIICKKGVNGWRGRNLRLCSNLFISFAGC